MIEVPRISLGGPKPGPEIEGAAEGSITVVQNYRAYFGYEHMVFDGAFQARDTLPKQTLADRTEYAILEPGEAVGVVDTNEGGVLWVPTLRNRLSRQIARMQPAQRSLIINLDGSPESAVAIMDTDENRRRLIEEEGIGIVPLTFEPTHTVGRPDLRRDRELFPYDHLELAA
jgi:hypothetical protein